jgi:hypothetical protein
VIDISDCELFFLADMLRNRPEAIGGIDEKFI